MVKILVIGDFHGKFLKKFEKIIKREKIDFILTTGDFGGSEKLSKILFKNFYLDLDEVLGKKEIRNLIKEDYNSGKEIIKKLNGLGLDVFCVFGNWDYEKKKKYHGMELEGYLKLIKKTKNMGSINKKIKKVKGLKVYGFGGMVTAHIYTKKDSGFDFDEIKMYKAIEKKEKMQLFKKGGKDIDILLAHYPPYLVFDKIKYKGKNPMNGKSVGFKPYLDFIKRFKPKIFICGHMHEYQGKKKIGNTTVIATGAAKDGKAAIIEMNDKIRVRFVS